jgi:hypothetical protein
MKKKDLVLKKKNKGYKGKYSPAIASARCIWQRHYQEMPFEDFYELSQQNCFYCNGPLSNRQNRSRRKNGHFKYNGLDRVDNSLPHSKDNCVPCCKHCNYAKRDRSVKDFLDWIKDVNKKIKNGYFNHLIKGNK